MKEIRQQKGFKGLMKKIFMMPVDLLCIPYFALTLQNRCKGLNTVQLVDFMFEGIRQMIRPFQVRSEIEGLAQLVASMKPARVLEIGTAAGGTLFLYCQLAADNATIVSLDLPQGRYGGGYYSWRIPLYRSFARKGQTLHLMRQDSHQDQALQKCRVLLNNQKVDFLFIDGDHTYEGVKRDFQMYSGLVRKGGMIAFHDIVVHPPAQGCNVYKFWEEIKPLYRHKEFIRDPDQKGAGIGVIFIDA
jgi:predicted O-methyltransferase YrrM